MSSEPHFLPMPGFPGTTFTADYDGPLVILSILIAMAAAFVALYMAAAARRATGRAMRHAHQLTATVALGLGVWSMHFTAMLALSLGPHVKFVADVTLISALPSMLGAAAMVAMVTRRAAGALHFLFAGLVMSVGAAAMHHIGMAALQLGEGWRHDPMVSAAALVVVWLAISLALWVAYGRSPPADPQSEPAGVRRYLIGSALMGLAIAGFHYTSMGTAWFTGDPHGILPSRETGWRDSYTLAWMVAGVTLFVSLFVAAMNALARYQAVVEHGEREIARRLAVEAALREAKEAAEATALAKSHYLAGVCVEMLGLHQMIMEALDGLSKTSLGAAQRKSICSAIASASRLHGLLDDLFDTARLEVRSVTLQCQRFSLRDMCVDIVSRLTPVASMKGVELVLEFSDEVTAVHHGDDARVRKILLKLVRTAVDALDTGSVHLRVQPGEDAGNVHIQVSGNGRATGLMPLETIFEPFSHVDPADARAAAAAGLGIHVARQLAELMNGHLSAERRADESATFYLFLPLSPAS